MSLFVVRMEGGLGNQMSQYAFYKKLQHCYGNAVRLKADYSVYKTASIHNGFELMNLFDINPRKLPQASRWELLLATKPLLRGETVYQTYASGYPEDLSLYHLPTDHNRYFYGTWHSNDYSDILEELRQDFRFVKPLSAENLDIQKRILQSQSVSIHVRRGGYLTEGLNILTKEYYRKAVELVSEKCEGQKLRFFVFSDDKEFVRDYFDFIPREQLCIISGNTGVDSYVDMQLMSCCKHNILANSTFSYWAALLNTNGDKIVIKPYMQTRERESWENAGWIRLRA